MNKIIDQDYEIRKHFEASIDDLATLYSIHRLTLRSDIKYFLIRKKVIEHSTTELNDEQLEEFASALNKFFARMNNTPPDERGVLDLQLIFNDLFND